MALSALSLTSCLSSTLTNKLNVSCSNELPRTAAPAGNDSLLGTAKATSDKESNCKRRLLLLGFGALTANLLPSNSALLAQEMPKNYKSFVDEKDGYSYYYPAEWIDFDFRGHDSAFKDRLMQLQNVRVRFIPTTKTDIHDLGPIDEAVHYLVKHVYAAPIQVPTIYRMEERSIDGKNYYTFEYELTSPNYSSVSIATIAIANGRHYTLIVGANERRWKRYRDRLKVVADSFRVLDI